MQQQLVPEQEKQDDSPCLTGQFDRVHSALHSASSAMLGVCEETVQTETASCRPLGVNKASLREHHCQEEVSFVIQ